MIMISHALVNSSTAYSRQFPTDINRAIAHVYNPGVMALVYLGAFDDLVFLILEFVSGDW